MRVNYYEVLGVDRSASESEIREKFRKLARERHPDRFQGTEKEVAEKTFQTLTEAVNVLTNPARRKHHDSELQSLSGKSMSDFSNVAKVYLGKGVKAYKEGDWIGARDNFDMAVKHNPEDAKAFHYLALACARSPATIRQAVQAIETAVQKEPMNVQYLKDAGLICKRAGLSAKAERFLDEAEKWDQNDPEIRAALDEIRSARSGAKESGKGILDSLFRKG